MEHHITLGELAILLAVLWLPVFSISAAFHWFVLAGRRWRAAWVLAAFSLSVILALVILFSPIADLFPFLGAFGNFFAVGGIPLQAGLLASLLITLVVLALWRLGLPPNNSFKPNGLRPSA